MLEFKVGERVSFEAEETVSLVTDEGHRWNVSPTLPKRVATTLKSSSPNAHSQNVLAFRKERATGPGESNR